MKICQKDFKIWVSIKKGFIDHIIPRNQLKDKIYKIVNFLMNKIKIPTVAVIDYGLNILN